MTFLTLAHSSPDKTGMDRKVATGTHAARPRRSSMAKSFAVVALSGTIRIVVIVSHRPGLFRAGLQAVLVKRRSGLEGETDRLLAHEPMLAGETVISCKITHK